MSAWRLTLRAFTDASIAYSLGVFVFLISLVVVVASIPVYALPEYLRQKEHVLTYEFSSLPDDGSALEKWLRSQPRVKDVSVRRTGSKQLEWQYIDVVGRDRSETPEPPWSKLGYKKPLATGGSSGPRFFFVLQEKDVIAGVRQIITPAFLFYLVLCSQFGFLLVGLRRLRRARQKSEPLPKISAGVPRHALVGAIAGLALFVFGFAYEAALGKLFPSFEGSNMWGVVGSFAPWAKIATLIIVACIVPVVEEFFFRGVMFGSFVGQGHLWIGAVVSAILFAALHFNLAFAVVYLIFGLVLAWLYRNTQSLLAPVMAHAINNALAVMLILAGH